MAGIFGGGDPKNETNAEELLRAADSAALHDAVLAAVRRGWLISFGRGRDGFAASVSVLVDGEWDRAWCESTAELETALSLVLTAATDLDRSPATGTVTGGKTRKVAKPRRAH